VFPKYHSFFVFVISVLFLFISAAVGRTFFLAPILAFLSLSTASRWEIWRTQLQQNIYNPTTPAQKKEKKTTLT
jgi:hypothetical protein